jgi:hypothetical protein
MERKRREDLGEDAKSDPGLPGKRMLAFVIAEAARRESNRVRREDLPVPRRASSRTAARTTAVRFLPGL